MVVGFIIRALEGGPLPMGKFDVWRVGKSLKSIKIVPSTLLVQPIDRSIDRQWTRKID